MTFKEILQKLINVEQEIYMLFLDLAELEIDGKQDSKEYHEKIELLQSTIELESFYFSHKALDIEYLLDADEFFENEIRPEYFDKSLTKQDIKRIYVRAYQLLEYAIDMDILEDEIKVLLPPDEEVNINNVIKYVFPKKRKLYKKYYEIIFEQKTINYGLNDRLYYIQEAIEKEKDKYTKTNLQLIKYFTAFCDGPFMSNITDILPKGPLTKIIHEQIEEESSSLRANLTDFLETIDDIMFEDANNCIEELLMIENPLANKKAIIAQLQAILPFVSKSNLDIINEILKVEKDTIEKIQIQELVKKELETRSYYNVSKSEIKPKIELEVTDEHIDLIKNLIKIDYSIYQTYKNIITLKSNNQANTKEFENWIKNLEDAYKIEKQYLNKIKPDLDYLTQFSLALNRDNLHLYTDEEIKKIDLLNISARIKSYIELIYNELLIEKLFLGANNKNLINELKKEQRDNNLITFLQKMLRIETFKTVDKEIQNHIENEQKELIADQFSTAFTNYFFTDTLLETKFDSSKLPLINSDYLYIISLELGLNYNYLENKVNEFMYENAVGFSELAKEWEYDESSFSKGYHCFLKAQIKATLPFLNEVQLHELGYQKEKILIK